MEERVRSDEEAVEKIIIFVSLAFRQNQINYY